MRPYQNFGNCLTSDRYAGLDPASRNIKFYNSAGFPFDFAQGGESFDVARDREPVERPVEPPPARE